MTSSKSKVNRHRIAPLLGRNSSTLAAKTICIPTWPQYPPILRKSILTASGGRDTNHIISFNQNKCRYYSLYSICTFALINWNPTTDTVSNNHSNIELCLLSFAAIIKCTSHVVFCFIHPRLEICKAVAL